MRQKINCYPLGLPLFYLHAVGIALGQKPDFVSSQELEASQKRFSRASTIESKVAELRTLFEVSPIDGENIDAHDGLEESLVQFGSVHIPPSHKQMLC